MLLALPNQPTMPATLLVLLPFLLSWTLLLAMAAPPPPALGCANELVSFSPCLSYVSYPPNNLTDTASTSCCSSFSSAFNSGIAVCFCYLLREPPILGFPLNSTRLLSLSSTCPPTNSTSATTPTLNSFCAASPALPPLHNAANLETMTPTRNTNTTPTPTPSQTQNPIPPNTGFRNTTTSSRRKPPAPPSKGAGSSGRSHGKEVPRPFVDGAVQVSSVSGEICTNKSWILAGLFTILVSLLITL